MPNLCNITKLREVEKAESHLQTCNNKTWVGWQKTPVLESGFMLYYICVYDDDDDDDDDDHWLEVIYMFEKNNHE